MDPIFSGVKSVISNLYDFYFIEAMAAEKITFGKTPQEKWKKDLTTYKKKFEEQTALALRDYLWMIACGEARHAHKGAKLATKQLTSKYDRSNTYKIATEYAPTKHNIEIIISIFESPWKTNGYGGKKWAKIAKAIPFYKEWKPTIFIDHTADLQHNNGTIFNKYEVENYLDFRINVGRQTMQKWLYNKSNIDILKNGNGGFEIKAAYNTKQLLKRFFVTQGIERPEWFTDINQMNQEIVYYKPIKWGTEKFDKAKETGNTWTTKKSYWNCVCELCTDEIIYCEHCKTEQDNCKCCSACHKPGDFCTCCFVCNNTGDDCTCCPECGETDCPYCYICDNKACSHIGGDCCIICNNTGNNCSCCQECHLASHMCWICEECKLTKCEHENNMTCITKMEEQNEKEQTKETEEKTIKESIQKPAKVAR